MRADGHPATGSRFASVVAIAIGLMLVGGVQSRVAEAAVARTDHPVASVRTALPTGPRTTAGPAGRLVTGVGYAPPTPYQDSSPYYEVSPGGAVWPLGGAAPLGQISPGVIGTAVVGVTLTPDDRGYWLVTAGGRVRTFGDAVWHGSPNHARLGLLPVGLVADADGRGYWVYGADGQVAAFGDAENLGRLTGGSPIVDMVATPDSLGYWLLGADGAVTPFGDARWYGGEGRRHLPQQFVGMAATADGLGYWLVSASGAVFPEGDAIWKGSLTHHPINQPIASIMATSDDGGYWLVAHDGDIHPFGDAASMSPPMMAFVHTVLTAGDRATEWAMAQLGKPYVWGAIGPYGFDCSGLTMEAWSAAGVAIPRVADDQFIYDPHVAMANLVDGDLVFYASSAKPTSIYHVGMYLGGGHMVNAPYTGQVVRSDWIGGYQFVMEGAAP